MFPWLCHFFFGVASQNQTKNDHLVVVLEDRVKIFKFYIFQFCQKQTVWVLKFLSWCFNDIWFIFKWIWVKIQKNSYLESTFQYLIVEILATLGKRDRKAIFFGNFKEILIISLFWLFDFKLVPNGQILSDFVLPHIKRFGSVRRTHGKHFQDLHDTFSDS